MCEKLGIVRNISPSCYKAFLSIDAYIVNMYENICRLIFSRKILFASEFRLIIPEGGRGSPPLLDHLVDPALDAIREASEAHDGVGPRANGCLLRD